MNYLQAPFPYFGGKARIARLVWEYLGDVKHYIEPFFGSGAVLLARPGYDPGRHIETVCDKDGFVANVWRAIQFAPDEVAKWCAWPVNHADLMARRRVLLANESRLLENLVADPEWYDAKLAGYWVWAASCWIAAGLTRPNAVPYLAGAGMGVHKLGVVGAIYEWMKVLSERLRRVRVVCGDWSRVCGGDWQDDKGTCGVFFDPPYAVEDRDQNVYHVEDTTVAEKVCEWALERGRRPTYRIVVAGYEGEHEALIETGWRVERWTASGGYAHTARQQQETQGKKNRRRERLFISPHCLSCTLWRDV